MHTPFSIVHCSQILRIKIEEWVKAGIKFYSFYEAGRVATAVPEGAAERAR